MQITFDYLGGSTNLGPGFFEERGRRVQSGDDKEQRKHSQSWGCDEATPLSQDGGKGHGQGTKVSKS